MLSFGSRANELFQKASLLGEADREAFLEAECRDDTALRQAVEALFMAHAAQIPSPQLFSTEMGEERALEGFVAPEQERPGIQIGRYTLRELIGEGGMGAVWIAEQNKPVRRRVALKLVKAGMDSKQVISRFEVERQSLALMDHPNIAKVYDGGVTRTGRPFFVMEYVRGIPITHYCDNARLCVRERLQLFVQVCQAVQHAHQKGIIHRDLKPSNILVCLYDGNAVPKVIDFGLAKAIHQPLTENTLYTAHGVMVGTPLYMSPEQAEFNNLDVDTRTDIYSLGVVLYELLTGTTPLERQRFKDAAWQEILRIIKEEEPQKPSTKISGSGSLPSVAAQRNLEPAQLSRVMRGDLDWIVMKTLEKERSRRYETASGLARDIQRYLNDEPVEACPPSLAYRLRKLAHRNKKTLVSVGILSVVILSAFAMVAGSIGWAVRDRQNRQAVVERQVQAALNDVATAFKQNHISDAVAAVKQAELLLVSSETRPEFVEAVHGWKADLKMVQRLGDIQLDRSDDEDDAAGHAITADAYRAAFEDYGIDVLQSGTENSAKQIRESRIRLPLLVALDDWVHWQAVRFGGTVNSDRDKLLQVLQLADDDLWRAEFRRAVQSNDTAELTRLAKSPKVQGQPSIVISLLATQLRLIPEHKTAIEVLRRALAERSSDFSLRQSLGLVLLYVDTWEAERLLRLCAVERPTNASIRTALGFALYNNDFVDDALSELQEAIRLRPDYAEPHVHVADAFWYQEKLSDAETEFRKAMQLNPRLYGPCEKLNRLLLSLGEVAKAEKVFREAVEKSPGAAPAYLGLGESLLRQKRFQEAEEAFRQANRLDPAKRSTYNGLAKALEGQQKLPEAEATLRSWVQESKVDPEPYLRLAEFLRAQSRWSEAADAHKEAARLDPTYSAEGSQELAQVSALLKESPDDALLLVQRGLMLAESKSGDQGLADILRAVELPEPAAKQLSSEQQLEQADRWRSAGLFLCLRNYSKEAAIALRRAVSLYEERQRADAHEASTLLRLAASYVYLASCLWSLGQTAESSEYEQRALTLHSQSAFDAHLELGQSYVSSGRWTEGLRHLDIVVTARPQDHLLAMQTAIGLLRQKDHAGYQRVCRRMLDMFGNTVDPTEADRTAKACLLSEALPGDLGRIARLANVATSDPKHGFYRYFALVGALSAYRSKDWNEAMKWCSVGHERTSDTLDVPFLRAHYLVVQALAQHRLGETDAAKASLLEATKIMRGTFPDAPSKPGGRWADWAVYEVLRGEAEVLIMPKDESSQGGAN